MNILTKKSPRENATPLQSVAIRDYSNEGLCRINTEKGVS